MDKVVHFEIPADDPARAKKFYSSVFGWKVQDVPNLDFTMVYTVATDERAQMPKEAGAINGVIMRRAPEHPTPQITIGVADIDKAVKDVVKAGGKIVMEKYKLMNMGWSVKFKDPEGNVVGLWQALK